MSINYRQDQGSLAGSLGKALGTAGGEGLNAYLNEMFQKRENKGFAGNLGKSLGLEGDKYENFVNTFGSLAPMQQIQGLLTQSQAQNQLAQSQEHALKAKGAEGQFNPSEFSNTLQALGIDQEKSNNYSNLLKNLPAGGRTKASAEILEEVKRSGGYSNKAEQKIDQEGFPEKELIEQKLFKGLTPSETTHKKAALRKENTPIYSSAVKGSNSFKKQAQTLDQLEKINSTGKLPTGASKLFKVNPKTGDLFLPAANNPETQLFVKLVNNFIGRAKDTFGSRVTNFDLGVFMRGLPTLANSPEGRALIIDQLKIENDLNSMYDNTLKEVYTKYGSDNIDPVIANELADKIMKEREGPLLERMNTLVEKAPIISAKINTPKDKVLVKVDGKMGYLNKNDAKKKQQENPTRIEIL
jgi:hypothetical protein